MPTDADDFTLSLFDDTALSGWNRRTPPSSVGSCGINEADADNDQEDGDTSLSAAAPAPRDSNFHLVDDRALARGRQRTSCRRWASDHHRY